MVFIRVIGVYMECGVYYAKDNKKIILHRSNGWTKEIKYIAKSYSSCMLSYVLFCYPFAENEDEEVKGCVNLYHDDEKILDEILQKAIEQCDVNLDLYYDDNDTVVE